MLREGELSQIIQRFQIVGMDARRVEGLLVVRDIAVGMTERRLQPLELKRANLIARSDLDRLEGLPARRKIGALELQMRHSSPLECLFQIFRCAAFQCFSRFAMSAGLKWQ